MGSRDFSKVITNIYGDRDEKMGCDIHDYVEQQRDNGTWYTKHEQEDDDGDIHFPDLGTYRNYALFGLLANVRRDVEGCFLARGFPTDASELVKQAYDRWEGDAHTPSFLGLKELKEKAMIMLVDQGGEPEKYAATALSDLIQRIEKHVGGETTDPEKIRLVFWFDN